MDEKIAMLLQIHKLVLDQHRARLILLERLLLKASSIVSDYFAAVKVLEADLLSGTVDENSGYASLNGAGLTRSQDSCADGLVASLQGSIDQARQAKDPTPPPH